MIDTTTSATTHDADPIQLPDRRRITEHDPAWSALHAQMVARLTLSLRRLVADLRTDAHMENASLALSTPT